MTKKVKPPPAYQRIEEDIITKVRDGRLPAGTMLASRQNLAREYGVALSTAQQAVANLIASGTLESIDRRGTFVASVRTDTQKNNAKLSAEAGQSLIRTASDHHLLRQQPPSLLHSSPQGTTSSTLGIIATSRINQTPSPDVGSLWASLAIRSLEQTFSAAGGTTRFFDRYPDSNGPYASGLEEANAISITDAIRQLQSEGADAFAIVGLCDARDMSDEVVRSINVELVPTVYISWHEIPPPLAQVYYDNRFAGYQAAQHLLRKGYHEIVVLAPFADGWLKERVEGVRSALRHTEVSLDALTLFPGEPCDNVYDRQTSRADIRAHLDQLFDQWAAPKRTEKRIGIIAPNDDIAYAVLDAAAERGKQVGVDFGLVGFDDDSRSCSVGLTTVRPPVEAMGEEAGRLLLQALLGEKRGSQVRLRSHLIPRSSTAQHASILRKETASQR